MSAQPVALRLANYMHDNFDLFPASDEFKTAAELRRLHEVNAELLKALYWVAGRCSEVCLTQEPSEINREAAYAAGAAARAAIIKAEGGAA